MRILVTGASGFIGEPLAAALHAQGHEVICATHSRQPKASGSCSSSVAVDFVHDQDVQDWMPRLHDIDVVINAVGIIRERGDQTFEALHVQAPRALFQACALARVRRVIQISALGADERAHSAYHLSKWRAEEALSALPIDWSIVQPSLVYGPEGPSAKLFGLLASLPLIPLVGHGEQLLQPVHADDVIAGIVALLDGTAGRRARIAFVGPRPLSMRAYLDALRTGMGLGRGRYLHVPISWVRTAAHLGERSGRGLLDRETLGMLLRGNVADPRAFERLLGRPPRAVDTFIPRVAQRATRLDAELQWLLPMLRLSVALVWIGTGLVSLGLFPVEASYALLHRTGVPAMWSPLFLYGAALLDLALGLGTLFMRHRRRLYAMQIALIVFYTLVITVRLPEFWLHPYGPMLKNLPMLAAIGLLIFLERR